MTILVGCSGWQYDDWVGRFYPIELSKKKGDWLAYYMQFFSTVEINSTFYRPPGERQVRSWIKKAKPGFEYSVKVPGNVTHDALVEGNLDRALFWAKSFETTCLKPLSEAGLLGAALLRLSPYFKYDSQSLNILAGLLEAISADDFNYAIEFRHQSWLDERVKDLDAEALEILKGRKVANVIIDGPGLHFDGKPTANHAYFRFHGRNYGIWYKRKKEDDHRLDRYDYLYRKEELQPWVPSIREAELTAAKVRIFFNNHARGKSAANSFLLMDMLSIEHKYKKVQLQDQFTLGEF